MPSRWRAIFSGCDQSSELWLVMKLPVAWRETDVPRGVGTAVTGRTDQSDPRIVPWRNLDTPAVPSALASSTTSISMIGVGLRRQTGAPSRRAAAASWAGMITLTCGPSGAEGSGGSEIVERKGASRSRPGQRSGEA